jgi:hypothetical protein
VHISNIFHLVNEKCFSYTPLSSKRSNPKRYGLVESERRIGITG